MARSAGKKTTTTKKTTDDQKYLCPYCLKEKKKSEFYVEEIATYPLSVSLVITFALERENWSTFGSA